MNVFSRSWMITKLSFKVIKADQELLLFPLLAGVFSLAFITVMVVPTIIGGLLPRSLGWLDYIIYFIIYLGLSFIATFFNVCVVYITKKRFEGGNATFKESLSFASSKLGLIFKWSLLAATVGLILRLLDKLAERSKGIGAIIIRLATSLFGMAWSILTIFVVPSMVYHNLGPQDAIKKSVETLKKTWGESIIRYYGLGLIQLVFIIGGVVLCIPLILVSLALGPLGLLLGGGLALIYFLGVILVFNVANAVFNTALYVYADTGSVPAGWEQEVLQNAFKSKQTTSMGHGFV